ncbi:hypothetical protein FWK35_00012918, partial [Aphis craccivora]
MIIERVEIMLQFQTVGVVSCSKMNLVVFKSAGKNQKKKNDGKTGIFTQNQFSTKSIFFMVVIQKLIILNFQKNLTFFEVDKKFLDDQKFKFLRNLSKTRKFAIRIKITILSFP